MVDQLLHMAFVHKRPLCDLPCRPHVSPRRDWHGHRFPAQTPEPIFKVMAYSCGLDNPHPSVFEEMPWHNSLSHSSLNCYGISPSVQQQRRVGETVAHVAKCSMIIMRHKRLHTFPPPLSLLLLSHPVLLMLITAAEALNVMTGEGESSTTCGANLRCCHTLSWL